MSIIVNPSTGQNIINVLNGVSNQINIITQDENNVNVLAGSLSVTDHNSLTNLQGGKTNENYHLTSGEYKNLVTFSGYNQDTIYFPTGDWIPNASLGYINGSFWKSRGQSPIVIQTDSSYLNLGLDYASLTISNTEDDSEALWYLYKDGSITFPDGSVQKTAFSDYITGINTFSGTNTFVNQYPIPYNTDNVIPSIIIDDAKGFQYYQILSGGINGYVKLGPFNLYDLHERVKTNTQKSLSTESAVSGNTEDIILISGESYPRSNPSGFITGISNIVYDFGNQNISGIKNFYSHPTVNGIRVLVSGDVTAQPEATGVSGYLQGQINTLNNQTGSYALKSQTGQFLSTGSADNRYVGLIGNQTIYDNKSFVNDVYINRLFVTGTETIANTTVSNIQSPYILLNLTGGAFDGGIFFVTGAGLTGINDSGAIIGFDHSDKFKFGISTRASDLSTLPTIGSVEQIDALSGYLEPQINTLNSNTGNYYLKTNPSGYITGIDNVVYTTGNQDVSGIKTFLTGVNISGDLNLRTPLSIGNGGTSATTASTARTNLELGTSDLPTFAGLTLTASSPYTTSNPNTITQIWASSGTAFTAIKVNITDSASSASSLLADLQVGGVSKFYVRKDGFANTPSSNGVGGFGLANELLFTRIGGGIAILTPNGGNNNVYFGAYGSASLGGMYQANSSSGISIRSTSSFAWASGGDVGTNDLILTRKAAASLRLGLADAAAPVAQTFGVQSASGATDAAGVNFTIASSQGTGTGTGGSIIFQTAPASGTSSTTQNALSNLVVLGSSGSPSSATKSYKSIGLVGESGTLWLTNGHFGTNGPQQWTMNFGGTGLGFFTGSGLALVQPLAFALGVNNSTDLFLARKGPASLRLGSADAGSSATITVTIAAPAVVTWNSHGLTTGSPIKFTTTGALPTGLAVGTTYYVIFVGDNTFNLATSFANALAGTTITTSVSQSGVHTGFKGALPQTLGVQSASTNTDFNGTDFVIAGSQSTGTGTGGSIVFRTAPASGTSSATQNALATALTIDSSNTLTIGAYTGFTGGLVLNQSSPSSRITWVQSNSVFVFSPSNNPMVYNTGSGHLYVNRIQIGGGISTSNWSANGPAVLEIDAANTLAQRNGTAAQTSRLYNTFTARGVGTTNLEALETKAVAAGSFIIQSLRGSLSGTARDIEFRHGAIDTNGVITNGALIATITSTGLTLANALAIAQGGTGATTDSTARTNLGLGTTDSPTFAALTVTGHFTAATKSFLIDHPTKQDKKLQYGVVESNQHSVFVRGKTNQSIINLPEEWIGLVHEDSVTVHLTPIGKFQGLFVVSQDNATIEVGGNDGYYNYTVYGERKDVDKLQVEI